MKLAAPRRKLSPAKRLEVYLASEGACALCGRFFESGERWEADHRIAHALEGGDHIANLRALCVPCHKEVTRKQAAVLAKVRRLIRKADRKLRRLGKREIRSRGFNRKLTRTFAGKVVIRDQSGRSAADRASHRPDPMQAHKTTSQDT